MEVVAKYPHFVTSHMNCPHPDDHTIRTIQTTDTDTGVKPLTTKEKNVTKLSRVHSSGWKSPSVGTDEKNSAKTVMWTGSAVRESPALNTHRLSRIAFKQIAAGLLKLSKRVIKASSRA